MESLRFRPSRQGDLSVCHFQKLNNLSQSNGIRKAKDKIQADLKKEFQAALKLSKSKSLGTYTHDASKCHVLNPETESKCF